MKKTCKKSVAVLAAASVCSSMLLNFPSGTFPIHWSASAEEPASNVEGIAINEENFPDANFRDYVKTNFDTTADDVLTKSERERVKEMDVSWKEISDLTGISYFTQLTSLNCGVNDLTTLDVSKNTELTTLKCYTNMLTTLDVSNNTKLTDLNCSSNQLTTLNLSSNTELTSLNCQSNYLIALDINNNTKLTVLHCYSNNLTTLDVDNNTNLIELRCDSNNLTALNLSNNTNLTHLWCDSNNLTALDVSNNTKLVSLSCTSNALNALEVNKNTELMELHCASNNLSTLDVSSNTKLTALYCFSNNLTTLDVSNNTSLSHLSCFKNDLTALDLRNHTDLFLSCDDNTYAIVLVGSTFDLNTLPGNFDASKASNWTNATVDGNTLTVTDSKANITYTYDLGNGKTEIFTLVPSSCELTEEMVDAIPVQAHTGSAITPAVTIKYGEKLLTEGTDYTISYAKNTEIGTATVTITGMGSFTGEITIPFEIGVAIDAANFPGETFRTYVQENFDTTTDGFLSKDELEQVTQINVSSKGITDLTGVEYFTALNELSCYDNSLTELDVRQNTALQTLEVSLNNLSELDVRQNTALQTLDVSYNNLSELDVRQNTALQTLDVSQNNLSELDVSKNLSLKYLDCFYSNLTNLDVRQNTALQTLEVSRNNLSELDVRQNTALKTLRCSNNHLAKLDIQQNTELTSLNCSENMYFIDTVNGTFDLSTLPDGFDRNKTSDWTNATVDGNTLTVTDLKTAVIYTYDLGNGEKETFGLIPNSCTLSEEMVVAIPEQIYDGSELKPDVTLKYGDYTLEQDTDYTISYEQNSSTGITEITATGKGFFNGTITVPFKVGIAINETTFPDAIFRAYVKENFDTTADDILTSSELAQIKDIDVTGKGISDLTGIQYFTQLTHLNCSDNELTTLDISQNTSLSSMDFSINPIKVLKVTDKYSDRNLEASIMMYDTVEIDMGQISGWDVNSISNITGAMR